METNVVFRVECMVNGKWHVLSEDVSEEGATKTYEFFLRGAPDEKSVRLVKVEKC